MRAVLSKFLIVFFSFVICVDVLGGATLRLWVELQLLLLILIASFVQLLELVIAAQHVQIINFSIDVTRSDLLIIYQFCHVFLIYTASFQNLEICRFRHLKRILVLHVGSGIFEYLICFDGSQGCCHEAFNLLIIAGFGFDLICFFLLIDLHLSARICIGRLFQIELSSSTLILSSHSERSRSSFAPLIGDLAQYLIQCLLLTQHLYRLLTSTFAQRFRRLAFLMLINRIPSGFRRAFLLRCCCILLHLNRVHFIFTSNLIGILSLGHHVFLLSSVLLL